jgi:hypothetical protein
VLELEVPQFEQDYVKRLRDFLAALDRKDEAGQKVVGGAQRTAMRSSRPS